MKLYIKNMVCPRCVSAVEKSLQNIGVAPIDVVDDRRAFCIGLEYTLPMLITADARLDTKGRLRFQLGREDVPVSARLRFSFMINTDKEYMAGLRYVVTKYISASTHYDSDMGYGAGLTFTY